MRVSPPVALSSHPRTPHEQGRDAPELAQMMSPLARTLVRSGVTETISASTIRRILTHHKLKPWRHHMWLSPKHPRDAAFYAQVTAIITLTRPLQPEEMVLSLDEKTSLQPCSIRRNLRSLGSPTGSNVSIGAMGR